MKARMHSLFRGTAVDGEAGAGVGGGGFFAVAGATSVGPVVAVGGSFAAEKLSL